MKIVMLQNENNKDWIPLATARQRELLNELGYIPLNKLSKIYAAVWIEKLLTKKKARSFTHG